MKRIHYAVVMSFLLAILGVACASRQSSTSTPLPSPPQMEEATAEDAGGSVGSHDSEEPSSSTPSSANNPQDPSTQSKGGAEKAALADPESASPTGSTSDPTATGAQPMTPGSPGFGESGLTSPADGTANSRPQPGSSAEDSSGGSLPPESTTADEKAAKLDRELDRALEDFDGLLLDEQERLEEQTPLGDGGGGFDSERAGAPGAGGTGEGSSPTDRRTGDEGAQPIDGSSGQRNDGGASGVAAGPGDTGDTAVDRVPPDVGDGSDDDIIARQLREAAESEEDPDLRERLWEEYRAYKASLDSDTGEGE